MFKGLMQTSHYLEHFYDADDLSDCIVPIICNYDFNRKCDVNDSCISYLKLYDKELFQGIDGIENIQELNLKLEWHSHSV